MCSGQKGKKEKHPAVIITADSDIIQPEQFDPRRDIMPAILATASPGRVGWLNSLAALWRHPEAGRNFWLQDDGPPIMQL